MAQSSLITVTKQQSRMFRVIKELVAALDTSTGHDHDGTDSKSITASVTYGVVGDMAAAGTAAANVVGTGNAARVDHVHAMGTHVHDGATTGGATLGDHTASYIILANTTVPAATNCYIARDNTGDVTVNALTGKTVNIAVAGTDIAVVASTGLTITGNLSVSGTFGITGNWDVAATLTVDELILDTDGVAPAGTNCYAVRDNSGDLTFNTITGKTINLAVNGSDEYTFSATVADFLGNAIDNAGYLILNAATAPAGTEVYAVNDNTGDLTLNALNTKSVHIAVAGTDEYDFSATAAAFSTNNLTFSTGYIQFSGAGYVDLGGTGYLIAGTAANATGKIRLANNTWISAENAAAAANVNMISINGSDLVAFGANVAAFTMGATLTMAAQSLSFSTGNITFSGAGYIAMGTNPASAGYIRLPNATNIAFRDQANGADINAITVNASDDVAIGADLQMGANVIYGSAAAHTADTADGSLYLHSTLHATKGFVVIPATHLGLVIGSDGSVDRATTVGTNAIHIFNGTAPAGTLTNGGSLYCEGGELKAMDATGNVAVLVP